MSFLDGLAAAYLAGRAMNVANRPSITVPPGLELRGIKAKGLSNWTIKYGKIGSSSTSEFTISNRARSYSGGWKFYWP